MRFRFRHRAPVTGWIDHLGREKLQLQRVIYDRAEQLAAFTKLLDVLLPVFDVEHSENRMDAVAKNLVDGILEFATYCKHSSFREEREWRVVYERSSDKEPLKVQHRTARGVVVPYVALKLPAAVGALAGHLPIVEVRCGPSPEPDLKQEGVQRLLRSSAAFAHVEVSGSDTPLRL